MLDAKWEWHPVADVASGGARTEHASSSDPVVGLSATSRSPADERHQRHIL